jgi:hypothetical protein
MDFRNLMKLDKEVSFSLISGFTRIYQPIQAGNYFLSVQASDFHWCRPKTSTDLFQYEAMEVVLFDKNHEWVNPLNTEEFNDFKRINEIRQVWRPGKQGVGVCVPVDLIQDFYDYLRNKK